ncbi:ABC transporter ATP-binding protein [Clostridium perfringens]|uniref:ABC transporter ATP-binding protein n=1 Tax=Clostridium perfringens TaxID=1502 RepID=UPI001C85EB7C|nr:ABC transporter ATP-binding protein [Clostridium perfringens]
MERKAIIEFKDFTAHYTVQSKPTLNNINLTIYEGEKVLIAGPSGSGKSTLANCINGLIPFSTDIEILGSLKIKGKETKDLSVFEISKMVGTVLQDPDSQFIGLTVAEDIAFKLENNCVFQEEMKKKVNYVSKIVDIENRLDLAPYSLSGGQKQRVTLAGTIVDDVDILLFDEPLASLDPAAGKASIELIDKIQKEEKKTVIIIEHRLEEVLNCDVDRIILMNEGEIIADTTPNEILASNKLKECGIREPLYITALKYSGYELNKEMNLENIDKLKLSDDGEKLKTWYKSLNFNKKEREEDTLLEFKNVYFSYDKKKDILNDINFKINRGDIVSVVGKNGAGKSTISKLICGFFKESKGDIIFEGKSLDGKTIKERGEEIGVVLQNPNQMISKTMIFDEVALGLRVRGIDEKEVKERVLETLKTCGLYPYRNWPVSALSFGQKKRVTIASILVLNPKVIILDEPTAGQDYKHYNEIMEFLLKLNKKGVTIILITHDMHLMLEYTDKAIVISNGRKIADTTSAEILTDKEVIEKASLKETSLYDLALKFKVEDPKDFVCKFIDFDRGARN